MPRFRFGYLLFEPSPDGEEWAEGFSAHRGQHVAFAANIALAPMWLCGGADSGRAQPLSVSCTRDIELPRPRRPEIKCTASEAGM